MSQSVTYRPGDPDGVVREICASGPDFVNVSTPTTPGELFMIRHGLGRVPHGAWVVKGDATGFEVTDCQTTYVAAISGVGDESITVAVA